MKRLLWRVTFFGEDGDTAYPYEVEALEVVRPLLIKHQVWLLHNRLGGPEVDLFSPAIECLGEVQEES